VLLVSGIDWCYDALRFVGDDDWYDSVEVWVLLLTATEPSNRRDCAQLRAAGVVVSGMPLLHVRRLSVGLSPSLVQRYDGVIVLSAHAVCALQGLGHALASSFILAIGPATARAVLALGLPVTCAPEPYNSEALVTHSWCQAVEGRKILIVSGKDSRAYVAQVLRQRGAHVDVCSVYVRVRTARLIVLRRLRGYDPAHTIIGVTSLAALEYWHLLVGSVDFSRWKGALVAVNSERLFAVGQQLGLRVQQVSVHPAAFVQQWIAQGVS
jgi:hypothetical protein